MTPMKTWSRSEIVNALKAKIGRGEPIIGGGADTGIFFSGARKRGAFSAELTPQDREFLRAVSIKPEA